jgi:type I protein arginine methyltransferase
MQHRPTGYSILNYGHMVNCEPRMTAYADALRQAVTPGCTVIDIGAGPGIFSILACKFGAGRVIAIDPDDSIELLPGIAEANGCAGKITIFKGLSIDYSPTAKADVIISDLRGALPLFEGHIATIIDARERLLAPGGRLIPSRDLLRLAIASTSNDYRPHEEPWLRNKFGIDLAAGHRFAANMLTKVNLEPGDLLSGVLDLAVLDYGRTTSPNFSADFDLVTAKGGTAHGLLLWFDAELGDAIGFSNAPGEPKQIYGQSFFPFERSVELAAGDRVAGELTARVVESAYVWTWRSRFEREGQGPPVEFHQSNFLANVVAADKLRTKASNFAPPARPIHEIDRYCLSLFDGKRTLEAVAAEVMEKFPDAFPNASAALNHVTRVAGRYEDGGPEGPK